MHKIITLTTILFAITLNSLSQNPKDSIQYKPKVGLVLSGGGAKGIAHIGTLKVLEKLGIKPDYITGTSMGSIMGGLYAAGYSARELDSIIRKIDWNIMLSDNIPLTMVVPEEKYDYRRYLFEFDLTKKGPVLPTGVVAGQGISEELNYLTWHVSHIKDFNDLPIPFRCVASDLVSGEPYVFKSGNLATAMRASMAIPSAFSPVLIDNMLLVDGGVLDNMPVQACKDMGADIIIAVNVGFRGLPKLEDYKSIGDILMGATMIRSNYEAIKALDKVDILIEPHLDGYGPASFFDGDAIIDLGEDAALRKYDELEKLADYLKSFADNKPIQKIQIIDKIFVEDIRVEGLKRLNKKFVLGKFALSKGNYYTRKDIENGLHYLIGTRYVETVGYNLELGTNGYILTLYPKEAFPSKYNFSVHYNDMYKASAIFNVAFRNYILNGSSVKASGEISEFPQISAELIDHVGHKQMAGSFVNIHWEKSSVPFIEESGKRLGNIFQNYTEINSGFLFSPNIKRMIRAGAYYKRVLSNTNSGVLDLVIDETDKIGNQRFGLNLNYSKNSVNDQFYPDRGMLFDVDLEYPLKSSSIYKGSKESYELLSDYIRIPNNNYLKIYSTITQYIPLSDKWNLSYSASLGAATKNMGSTEYFTLGGLKMNARATDIPLLGLVSKEISAQQYIFGGLSLRYEPINNLFIKTSLNALDYKTNFNELSFAPLNYFGTSDVVFTGGITVSYLSILGPVEFGFGRSSIHNQNRFYFTAGFPF